MVEKFMNFTRYIYRGYPGVFKPNIWNQAEDHVDTILHSWISSLNSNKAQKAEENSGGRKEPYEEKAFLIEKIFIHDVDTLVWTNNLCLIF